ncbi:hypothetical protein VP01_2133g1 [Puccinia sorghi]|uniref:Uncharacterized protein n=1 Tax=Puccinia sorghi TaxID=27349 RepID=A0A0L6VAG4_9BASI|nr:hypothetical protein VP01_2133g1 [Puccinia sorghi]
MPTSQLTPPMPQEQLFLNVSSPTPSDQGALVADFLKFSCLSPSSSQVLNGLNELGFTYWLLPQHVPVIVFLNFKIPVAQTRALMLKIKK